MTKHDHYYEKNIYMETYNNSYKRVLRKISDQKKKTINTEQLKINRKKDKSKW